MNFNKSRQLLTLLGLTFFVTVFFWLIFYFHLPSLIGYGPTSLETVFANYDGPNYMAISKCGYDKSCIGSSFSLPQPHEYYPAHFPGLPWLIKFFAFFTSTPKAMILSALFGSLFLTYVSYHFYLMFVGPSTSFWLTIVSLFLPARLLILRVVGAPETWFIGLTLSSIIFFRKKQYLFAAVFAALSQFFKSPAILLFTVYGLLFTKELLQGKNLWRSVKNYCSFLLIPLVVLLIFSLYQLQTGDFLAYFHSGDNFHLNWLPYQIFISAKSWIGTIWLEDAIYIYFIIFYAAYRLYKKYKFDIIAVYPLVFSLAVALVAHRDLSRYASPIYPFAILATRQFLLKKSFRTIFYLIVPAIILYATNFIVNNTAPISDWAPYL